MKRWSLDARSQAPLDWSHRVGREAVDVRRGRTTPQPLMKREMENSMRAVEGPMPAVVLRGENEGCSYSSRMAPWRTVICVTGSPDVLSSSRIMSLR